MKITINIPDNFILPAQYLHQISDHGGTFEEFFEHLLTTQILDHPDTRCCTAIHCERYIYPTFTVSDEKKSTDPSGFCTITTAPVTCCPTCGAPVLTEKELGILDSIDIDILRARLKLAFTEPEQVAIPA